MEALEGETLQKRIAHKRTTWKACSNVMLQVAEGLDAAHAKGIVHRDIKPSNIFVTTAGDVKILDFGLAKLAAGGLEAGAESSGPTMTSPGVLVTSAGETMGTIAFMSPEQVRGDELDARTDIFSFGVVMYEMATGRCRSGSDDRRGLRRHPQPAPAAASSLNPAMPAELDHILDKALEKDRDLRYQSARELRADLARLRRDSGSAESHDVQPAPAPRRPMGRDGGARGGGLGALAIGGYVAWKDRAPAASDAATALSRVTFEDGLQAQPTWSPDGRFIAYTSDQAGNFDIWVQPVAGGRAVQVTTDPAADWQPAWSPDGNSLAFRSEREGGGIFVAPAFGGRERRLTTFGFWPQWSPKDPSSCSWSARCCRTPHWWFRPSTWSGSTARRRNGFSRTSWRSSEVSVRLPGIPTESGSPSRPRAPPRVVSGRCRLRVARPARASFRMRFSRCMKKASSARAAPRWAPAGDAIVLRGHVAGRRQSVEDRGRSARRLTGYPARSG